VPDWLDPAGRAGAGSLGPPVALVPEGFGADWSAWEPVAGTGSPQTLLIVRRAWVSAAGIGVAALFGLLIGLAVLVGTEKNLATKGAERRGSAAGGEVSRGVIALVVGGLAAASLALLWLPPALAPLAWWPALAGGVAAAACLWQARPRRRRTGPSPFGPTPARDGRSAAAALLALVCVAALSGRAAAPAPTPVYLVPADVAAGRKETVLVPPDLLTRLEALARRTPPTRGGPVVVRARYQGTPADAGGEEWFRFVADYQVWCPSDAPTTLSLPLSGVELEIAYLDGARAFPTTAAAPQPGYHLTVEKGGMHVIQFQFVARPTADGATRNLTFAIPAVLQSHLALTVPTGTKAIRSVLGRGIQRVTAGGLELHAELGGVRTVHLRWQRDEGRGAGPGPRVRESYFWDLGPADNRLLGVLQYTLGARSATELTIDLPTMLEVRKVETGPVPRGAPVPQLRAALVGTGGVRQLRLEFEAPVAGDVQVLLDLVPRRPPFGPAAALPLPSPRAASAGESFLAYRLHGLQAPDPQHRGVTFCDPEAFSKQWRATGAADPGLPTRAYTFQRPAVPVLQLNPAPVAAQVRCTQDISWRLDAHQAEVRVVARLSAPAGDLFLVDWQVPPLVTVTDVAEITEPGKRERAARVRQWSSIAGRVQVWLDRPVTEAKLQLTAWVVRPPQAKSFDLPCLRLPAARPRWTVVHIATAPGLELEPVTLQGLWPLPDSSASTWHRGYVTERASYSGVFRTRPSATRAEARILTFAEVRDRRLAFVATIDYRVRRGELRTATVRLRNWKGTDVQIEADHVAARHEEPREPASHTWVLELQPGVTGSYRVTLRGSLPAEGLADLLMPDVSVMGVARQVRWLGLAEPELEAADPWGLVEIPNAEAAPALRPWPGSAERLRRAGGSVWRVESDRWRLRLQPRPVFAGATPIRLVLAEQSAAALDGSRWVHEATYWLFHEAGAALDVRLPAGAALLALAIDGVDMPRLQAASGRLWLPLPGGVGPRRVTLRWVFDLAAEPFAQPDLSSPRIAGVAPGASPAEAGAADAPDAYRDVPTVWTIHIPPGYRVRRSSGAAAAQAAGAELRRAEAQAVVSELLADRAQTGGGNAFLPQLRTAQERFYHFCRRAEYAVALAPGTDTGPQGQSLAVWLGQLRERNRQRMARFEGLRAQAEKEARLRTPAEPPAPTLLPDAEDSQTGLAARAPAAGEPAPDSGTPAHWVTPAGLPTLRLDLTRTGARPPWHLVAASALLVLLLLGLEGRLARFTGASVWAWRFWPEGLAGLVLLAWPAFGLGPAIALLTLAVGARVLVAGRWLRAQFPGKGPALATADAGGGPAPQGVEPSGTGAGNLDA
jgi:hypothetical protein